MNPYSFFHYLPPSGLKWGGGGKENVENKKITSANIFFLLNGHMNPYLFFFFIFCPLVT